MNKLPSKPANATVHLLFFVSVLLLVSCTVTNNLYVNDPSPLPKGKSELYGGIGMGLKPRIDSVSANGEVFSNDFRRSYSLLFGGRYGVNHFFTISGGIHLPEIVGGIGGNIRPQISLFPDVSPFNVALAGDLGFVFAKDSVTFLGTTTEQENLTKGAIHGDVSLPMSVSLSRNTRLVLTPRYSFNTFYFQRKYDMAKTKRNHVQYPALSLGLRTRDFLFESSLMSWSGNHYYVFGLVIFIRNFDNNLFESP